MESRLPPVSAEILRPAIPSRILESEAGIADKLESFDLFDFSVVPGGGIEPPTQGFSGLAHVVSAGRFWSVLVCFLSLASLREGGNDQKRPPPASKMGRIS